MLTIKLSTGVFEYDPAKPLGKRGGFGQVFTGKTANGQDVAIKKLHVSAADAAHRELKIANELKGNSKEYVIPFIDAGEDAGTGHYFVVMAKAEGNLQGTLEKDGPLIDVEGASVLLQIVKGLLEVGELVHRDLKPDNVLFHEGRWKIADFGIARFIEEATSSNTLKDCLSPYYAAPEQWLFERATHATDVYALGCIGFFLLTGQPPFITNPREEHLKGVVPEFSCSSPRLSGLINMMMRKLPQTRPSLSRIENFLEGITTYTQHSPIANDPFHSLAQAAAQIANAEQSLQAQNEARAGIASIRINLAKHSFEILSENIERLWGKIHNYAPNAIRRKVGKTIFECQIGSSSLRVDLANANLLEVGNFQQSCWDVISSSYIELIQYKPEYFWSSSLWYVKLPEALDYRWIETSYWDWNSRRFQPFACSDLRDADLAASKVTHNVSIAFGPLPIDDEREDDFHERWIWLLVQSINGRLKYPSSLPIEVWPPSL